MPIEIKITDIAKLTKDELNELICYLKKTWYSHPSTAQDDPYVIKQEIDEELNNDPPYYPYFPPEESKSDNVRKVTGSPVIIPETIKKPRKKRTPKQQSVGEYGAVVSYGTKSAQTTEFVPLDTIQTYEEAIAEILEKVKENKISFEQINTLLNNLNIKTLSDLKTNQELIAPFVKSFLEITND